MLDRGHGTFLKKDGQICAAVNGYVERLNRLVCVQPVKTRYQGNVGDVVVGRILEVSSKRWKVDINAGQDAVLALSAINLPGGLQRRKCEEDELQMRKFYREGDVICVIERVFRQRFRHAFRMVHLEFIHVIKNMENYRVVYL